MQTPPNPSTLRRILEQQNKLSDVTLLECELDGLRVTTDRSSRSYRESVDMFAPGSGLVPMATVEAARAAARAVAQPVRDAFKGKTLWFRQLTLDSDHGNVNVAPYSPVKVIDVVAPDVFHKYDSTEPKFILQTESGEQGWTQFVRDPAPGYLYVRDPRQMFPARVWAYIERGKIFIGMTKDQALASWGEPERVNRTLTRGGVSEQWVYGPSTYLYFSNGRLTAAQN
jgi:hypothetical protein